MRPYTLILLAVIVLLAACQPAETPRTVEQYTIEQFMDNTAVFGSSFSADESKVLVTSDQTGIRNAFEVPVKGGDLTALTESEGSSVYAVSYFPEDDRFIFQMDDNGNEIWHLFVQDTSGQVIKLTPGEGARANFYGWAHDRQSFFIGWTKRDPKLTDVYEVGLDDLEPELIYTNDDAYNFGGISPDKKYMALTKAINTNDNQLYLYDFDNGTYTQISEEILAAYNPADFSPDGRYFYYLTDKEAEFAYLMRYDIEAGTREKVLERDWDISYAYFSRSGKYRVVGINQDAKTVLEITDT